MTMRRICAYCGDSNPATRDHVPPRCVFTKPLPKNLITVPACHPCHQRFSVTDDDFCAMLSTRISEDSGPAITEWRLKRARGIRGSAGRRGNWRQQRELLRHVAHVLNRSKEGGLLPYSKTVLWNADSHDRTLIRVTRALYFRQFSEILPLSVSIHVLVIREFSQQINDTFQNADTLEIGGGQFVCRYLKDDSHPFLSLWLYEFHGKHRGIAGTNIAAETP